MGTPLGDFVRARRDALQPESLGLPEHGRRRAPGLRRADLAARAGISVEYLTRIEQGRDTRPSVSVVNGLADALSLDAAERAHLRLLARITGGVCVAHDPSVAASRTVRPAVAETLRLLEPGAAALVNRLGDVLARTTGFEALLGGTGLLDAAEPNLTRYVFTDPRAREVFPEWEAVADDQLVDLRVGACAEAGARFAADLAAEAGPDFTRRLHRPAPPRGGSLRLRPPGGPELRLDRVVMAVPPDEQQILVLLPADPETARAVEELRGHGPGRLRALA